MQPEVLFDTAFAWKKPATQKYLMEICTKLDASGFVKLDKDAACTDEPCEQRMTACVVDELAKWLNTTAADCSVRSD